MDGSILVYEIETGEGTIRSHDGDHFTFSKSDLKGGHAPSADDKVTFAGADGRATNISLSGRATAPFWSNPHILGAAAIILGWILADYPTLMNRLPDTTFLLELRDNLLGNGVEFLRKLGSWMFLALYAIPLFSIWLLYKSFTHTATKNHTYNAALSAILFPFFVPIFGYFTIFLGLPGDYQFLIMRTISNGENLNALSHFSLQLFVHIDVGGVLILVGGLVIVMFRNG